MPESRVEWQRDRRGQSRSLMWKGTTARRAVSIALVCSAGCAESDNIGDWPARQAKRARIMLVHKQEAGGNQACVHWDAVGPGGLSERHRQMSFKRHEQETVFQRTLAIRSSDNKVEVDRRSYACPAAKVASIKVKDSQPHVRSELAIQCAGGAREWCRPWQIIGMGVTIWIRWVREL